MTFKTGRNAPLGIVGFALAQVSSAAEVPVGTIVHAYDDTYGCGEFIYLLGVAATAAGDAVVYDTYTPATVRTLSGTHLNKGWGVAWAVSACVAAQYGWYQISGNILANGIAGGAAGNCFLTTTAGCVDDTAIAGCQVLNARIVTAMDTPVTGKVIVVANRPFVQGQIT